MKIFQKYLNMGKNKIYETKIIKDDTVIYVNKFIMEEKAAIFEYSNQDIHFFFLMIILKL
jgi:hypothetical protein